MSRADGHRAEHLGVRAARRVEFAGEVMTLSALARRVGLPAYVLFGRLRRGWALGEAVGVPHPSPKLAPGMRRADRPRLRPCPAVMLHKGTRQAYVEWREGPERFRVYLGVFGSAKARHRYREFRAEWAERHLTIAAQAAQTAQGVGR